LAEKNNLDRVALVDSISTLLILNLIPIDADPDDRRSGKPRTSRGSSQILVNSPEGPRFFGLPSGSEGASSDGLPRELEGDRLGERDGGLSGEAALGISGDGDRGLGGDAGSDRTGDTAGALLGIRLGDLLTGDSLGASAGDRMGDLLTGDLARDLRGLVGGISRGLSSGLACGSPRPTSLADGIRGATACLLQVQLRACSSACF